MNQYQFESIARKMEKQFGKMDKEKEAAYAMIMYSMESNAFKTFRKYPASNSRRMREAILLTLHTINGYLEKEQPDIGKFETDDNIRLKHALLMAFDPYTNDEIGDSLGGDKGINFDDDDFVREYYTAPVQCLIRILDSVDLWEKRKGSNGYFDFLDEWMGEKVERDEKMTYSILLRGERLVEDEGE